MTLRARFEDKYIPEPNSGCWLWTSATKVGPYYERPVINLGGKHGRAVVASRVSWLLYRGSIPNRLHVLHKCDVPLCVNPDHLFLGTHQDNMRDMMAKGRYPSRSGEAAGGVKLTAREVQEIRQLRGHVTHRELAAAYGVAQVTIGGIYYGRSWKHLP